MKNLFAIVLAASLGVLVPLSVGCDQRATEGTKAKNEIRTDYPIKGDVVAVGDDRATVTLDHEEIPDVMKAMKMKYKVEDPKVLDGIDEGDKVEGRLKVDGKDYVITSLREQ